jgi:hypothetical protein
MRLEDIEDADNIPTQQNAKGPREDLDVETYFKKSYKPNENFNFAERAKAEEPKHIDP